MQKSLNIIKKYGIGWHWMVLDGIGWHELLPITCYLSLDVAMSRRRDPLIELLLLNLEMEVETFPGKEGSNESRQAP